MDVQKGNLTRDNDSSVHGPSVWSLVKGHINSMLDQAVQRTHMHLGYSSDVMESFRQRLKALLEGPLKNVATGHQEGQGTPTIHKEVEGAVEGAVDEAMHELNMTDTLISNTSLSSVKEKLVITLDSEIELDVFNKVFTNETSGVESESDFFHNLPVQDETMFITLICMGIIIPVIFGALLVIFFYRRQQDTKERSQEMLLQEQPDFCLDEYNPEERPTVKVEIPDLDFHNLKI